jgi:hypothetical protein
MDIAMSLTVSQSGAWEAGFVCRELKREKDSWIPVENTNYCLLVLYGETTSTNVGKSVQRETWALPCTAISRVVQTQTRWLG